MRLAVLLVGTRAPELADALAGDDRLDALAAASGDAGRAYLSGTALDRVVTLGDSGVAAAAAALGVETLALAPDATAADVLRALGLGDREADPRAAAPSPDASSDRAEAVRRLRSLRAEIDRVAHDLNNPVAVILGNAQLARELGAAAGLDPAVAGSLDDIETAAGQLAERARELGALRRLADAALEALRQP